MLDDLPPSVEDFALGASILGSAREATDDCSLGASFTAAQEIFEDEGGFDASERRLDLEECQAYFYDPVVGHHLTTEELLS